MDTIDLYAAIEEMKRISDTGGTFSMKFRKYNRHTSAGGDMVTVKAARLRSKTSDEKIENSSYKLFLYRHGDRPGRQLLAGTDHGV